MLPMLLIDGYVACSRSSVPLCRSAASTRPRAVALAPLLLLLLLILLLLPGHQAVVGLPAH